MKRRSLWLLLALVASCDAGEIKEGASSVATPTIPEDPVLAKFAGCMTQENWDASGMSRWANKLTEAGGSCRHCHFGCGGGFCAHADAGLMLQRNRAALFVTGFFRRDGGSVASQADRLANTCGRAGHPSCATNDDAFTALEEFVRLTNELVGSGCETNGFAK